MGRLAEKVVIITGAGSGIGRATAKLFAAEGARVAVLDKNGAAARETAEEVRRGGGVARRGGRMGQRIPSRRQ